MSFLSSKSAPGLQGANDIPAPMSDADRNAAPADTHKRIVDFVKVSSRSLGHLENEAFSAS